VCVCVCVCVFVKAHTHMRAWVCISERIYLCVSEVCDDLLHVREGG